MMTTTIATIICSSMAAGRCFLVLLPNFFFGVSGPLGDATLNKWIKGML